MALQLLPLTERLSASSPAGKLDRMTAPNKDSRTRTRRGFLKLGVGLSAAMATLKPSTLSGQQVPAGRPLGRGVSAYGSRSRFETAARAMRASRHSEASASRTPLQDLHGITTPSALHFERHHAGVPDINPARHQLLIHGRVDRPVIFTLEEIRRLPSESRVYFLECSGNSRSLWGEPGPSTAQSAHGMVSGSEWVGVPLSRLLEVAGVRPEAGWLVAEGADACRMTRSIPLEKALDDTLVAYGQNGEAIRPEQGYPLRLFVPGWEGNVSIKWLRRVELVDQPAMTREETSKYTDLLPDGTARQFTFVMEAKSVITEPSGGQQMGAPGRREIRGLAWSGRGRVERVEVSVDGGRSWRPAELQSPVLPLSLTRFRLAWTWDGGASTLASRCIDETGYVQPTRGALIAARGIHTSYHNNAIQSWQIAPDGTVENVYV